MKINKVLVVRLSSIGDIVLTSPVVRWLKDQHLAEVHFLTKSNFENILKHNVYIDHIHLLDESIENELLNKLRLENFDLVIDLHKSLKTRRLCWQLGNKIITFDKLNIQKWMLVNFKKDFLPDKHLVDRYLEALQPIGIEDDGLGLDFFIDPQSLLPAEIPDFYEVLVLGAAHATKRIPKELALRIINSTGKKVVLIGGKDVVEEAQYLEQNATNVINLTGKCDLSTSALILQKSDYIYTGDTGMMHIAAALKKPMTVFWGNTTPKFGMYPYYGFLNLIPFINKEVNLSCRPCSKLGYKACPKGHFNCMMLQDV